MSDVVERPARRCANEGVHLGVELHERIREMRSHEAVRTGYEAGSVGEELAELPPQIGKCLVRPGEVVWV